jgi:hypothetical protein
MSVIFAVPPHYSTQKHAWHHTYSACYTVSFRFCSTHYDG